MGLKGIDGIVLLRTRGLGEMGTRGNGLMGLKELKGLMVKEKIGKRKILLTTVIKL